MIAKKPQNKSIERWKDIVKAISHHIEKDEELINRQETRRKN